MKIRSNITLDDRLKNCFDASKNIHGKTLSEVLDEAIRNILDECVPFQYLEHIIEEKNEELVELQKAKAYRKSLEQHIRNKQAQKEEKEEEDPIDILRKQKIPKIAKTVNTNIKNGYSPNWENIATQLAFDSIKECKNWVMRKMVEEEYISKDEGRI